jgi:hypothetical protein
MLSGAKEGRARKRSLTLQRLGRYRKSMPQSIFIFDFGSDEDAAQQARHRVESWKQGFRLGNKMSLKFEREETASDGAGESGGETKEANRSKTASKKAAKKQEGAEKTESAANIRLLVRLDFSDHEKLSHQRWIDRIPAEEPFKSAKVQTIRTGDPEFPDTSEKFDSLD